MGKTCRGMGRKAVVDLWCLLTSARPKMRQLIEAVAEEATKGPSQERAVAASMAEETQTVSCDGTRFLMQRSLRLANLSHIKNQVRLRGSWCFREVSSRAHQESVVVSTVEHTARQACCREWAQ
jgi:hypothetical protein